VLENSKNGRSSSATARENYQKISTITLWSFNIAIENGHRNSGFSH
jgi:hypothetical protein